MMTYAILTIDAVAIVISILTLAYNWKTIKLLKRGRSSWK